MSPDSTSPDAAAPAATAAAMDPAVAASAPTGATVSPGAAAPASAPTGATVPTGAAAPATVAAPAATAPDPEPAPASAPLGPGSLTWRCFGDVRGLLLVARAGILQNMHPAIAAGVQQHSDFFANPWNRLLRSAPPILGVVYDGPRAGRTGATVRDYHRGIGGVDDAGRRYHALAPETYYWAHAVFFESQIAMRAFFDRPLTDAEQEQLYRESVGWYARYGVSMRPVPRDYAAFRAYWDDVVERVLEPTEPVRWTFDPARRRDVPRPYPSIPRPAWWALRPLIMRGSLFIARGTLPPRAREKLGLRWTPRDERRLRALGRAVRIAWRLLPRRWRYLPRARAAWERELGAPAP